MWTLSRDVGTNVAANLIANVVTAVAVLVLAAAVGVLPGIDSTEVAVLLVFSGCMAVAYGGLIILAFREYFSETPSPILRLLQLHGGSLFFWRSWRRLFVLGVQG